MSRKTPVKKIEAKHGYKQGTDVKELVQVKYLRNVCLSMINILQSIDRCKDQRKCVPGAEICELQPAAAGGAAGRAELLCGAIPGKGGGGVAHDPFGTQRD